MGPLQLLAVSLADVVWPRRCTLCGDSQIVEDDHELALDTCLSHGFPRPIGVGTARARCRRCFGVLPPGVDASVRCRECRVSAPAYSATVAPFDYQSSGIDEWILRFKHAGRRDLARPLARMVFRGLQARRPASGDEGAASAAPSRLPAGPQSGDLLVPVPLHPVRLAERGYDQAALFATEFAALSGAQVMPLLRRTRATHVQGDAVAPPRRLNVQGAFSARCRLPGGLAQGARRIWLVDDVMTSGATASACAAALRSAGAGAVHVLAIARA